MIHPYLNAIDASVPSNFRAIVAVKAFVDPNLSSSDKFWESAKKAGETLRDYVRRLLKAAATYFKSTKFTDIAFAMNKIVSVTASFRDNIKGALDAHGITFDTFTKELESMFTVIVNDLEKASLPDKASGDAERVEIVDKFLDATTQALVQLAARCGIDEEVVTSYLLALRPHVQTLIVAIGMSVPPSVMPARVV